MYDHLKAKMICCLQDIDQAVTKMEESLDSREAVLSDATRLAVLDEQLQLAKKRLANANYDVAQSKGYGAPYNFSPDDIVKLDDDIVHLKRLVTSAKFAVESGG